MPVECLLRYQTMGHFTRQHSLSLRRSLSKLKFEGYRIPLLPNVVDAVKRMHYSLPAIGVINWDMTLDESGQPVLIEANVNGGSIWLFQMAHGCGVFGERTPEILRWLHKMNETKYSDRAQYYFGE